MNQLILGDCLEVMKGMESESIDLIYLDPPFFSNRNYEVIWGDKGEIRSFEDRWSGGIDHYIGWLKERVQEMHRLLKPTGSIYLHCDWHADAYIRVYILDKIFGIQNFRNKITWKRATTHNDYKQGAKQFGRVCDYLYLYNKDSRLSTFNTIFEGYTKEYIESTYNKVESNTGRRFKASDLSAAKPGGDTYYDWHGKFPPKNRFWAYSKENMQAFEREGRLYYSSKGKPYLKHYLDEMPGVSIDDLWLNCQFKKQSERIGYPTQKPEALMERVIKSASNEGDTVLDPFVGGGTTVVVADKYDRKWIGIDQSVQAIKISELRINKNQGNLSKQTGKIFTHDFIVQLHKYDYDTLRYKDAFEFESFIITQFGHKFGFGAIPQNKKGGDKGFDGKTRNGTPIQVKRSDNISVNVIKNFYSSCIINERLDTEKRKMNNEPIGYIIAFSFGSGTIQEAAKLKNQENVIIKLVRVDEIVEVAHRPKLTVEINDLGVDEKELRVIEFIAKGISDTLIEFYSWDFNYNADEKKFDPAIMLDKEGKQSYKFKPGTYNIAVKVVDAEGLEAIEIIKLKVNGVVELQ
jgi:DNA modification methylase